MARTKALRHWGDDKMEEETVNPALAFPMQVMGLLAVWVMRFASGVLSSAGIYALAEGFPAQVPLATVFFFLPFAAAVSRQLAWSFAGVRIWSFTWTASFATTIVGLVMFFTLVSADAKRSVEELTRLDTTAESAVSDVTEKTDAAAAARATRDAAAARMTEVEASMAPLEAEVARLNDAMVCEEQGGCPGWDGKDVVNPGRGPRWRDGQAARLEAIAIRDGFLVEVQSKREDLRFAEEALIRADAQLATARGTNTAAEEGADAFNQGGRYKQIAEDAFKAVVGIFKADPSLGDIQIGLAIFMALAIDAIAVQRAPIPQLPRSSDNEAHLLDPKSWTKRGRRIRAIDRRQVALLRGRLATIEEAHAAELEVERAKTAAAERMLEDIRMAQDDARKSVETTDSVNQRAVQLRRDLEGKIQPPRRRLSASDVFSPAGLITPPTEEDDDDRPTDPSRRRTGEREHEVDSPGDDEGVARDGDDPQGR